MVGYGGCISSDGKGCRGSAGGRGGSGSGKGGSTGGIGSGGGPIGAPIKGKGSTQHGGSTRSTNEELEKKRAEWKESVDKWHERIKKSLRKTEPAAARDSHVKTRRSRLAADNSKPPSIPTLPSDKARLSAFLKGEYNPFPELLKEPKTNFVSPLHLDRGLALAEFEEHSLVLRTLMSPMPQQFGFDMQSGVIRGSWGMHMPYFFTHDGRISFGRAIDAKTSFYGALYGPRAPLYQQLSTLYSKPNTVVARNLLTAMRSGGLSAREVGSSEAYYYADVRDIEHRIKRPSPKFDSLLNDVLIRIRVAQESSAAEIWAGAAEALQERLNIISAAAELRHSFSVVVSQSTAKVKAWLAEVSFGEVAERVSNALVSDSQDNSAWDSWERVGTMISDVILDVSDAGETRLKETLRHRAICWERAKAERAEMRCVEAFKDHLRQQTKQLVTVVLSILVTKGKAQQAAKAGGVHALIKALDDSLHDPRCDLGKLEREVDRCVTEMYKDARKKEGR